MTSSIRARNRRRVVRALACASLLAMTVAPSAAELAILEDGEFLKIDGFEVTGEKILLDLASGGELTLPLIRVERIVDDEIAPEPSIGASPAIPLAFESYHRVPETPYGDLIFQTSKEHSVNPDLVAAMVRWESAFDPEAVSAKGARGLMQLMPATGHRFGVEVGELFDPAQNLQAGVRYLKWLRKRFSDDLSLVLAAYNAGEGSVDRYSGVPPYRETLDYIERIYSTLGAGSPDGSEGRVSDGR